MNLKGLGLRSVSLQDSLYVDALSPAWLEFLFFGGGSRPSWPELHELGPIRFSTSDSSSAQSEAPSGYSRDFADSCVHCKSGGDATVAIHSHYTQSNQVNIPAAMSFAFAQQWARHGHACFHGALLRVERQGVLVVGARAAGKSVLSASALAAGGAIITDDFFLLGDKGGVIFGERIRRFLSLRSSWAADSLVEGIAEDWTPDRRGRRLYLRVPQVDNRFPEFARVDKIWVLKRPRSGRREHSSLEKISHAEVYAALVSAIQPLLLGANFPHERAKLQTLLGKLMSSVPAARIETGQDIVLDPKGTWDRLLECSP